MRETLKRLLALQDLDLRIGDLKKEKGSLSKSISDQKSRHNARIEEFEKEKTKLTRLQAAMKELEVDLEALQERRKKLEAQQAAVKTNQEYKALNKEILDTLAEVDRTEEQMLRRMEEAEEEKGRLKELQEAVGVGGEDLNQRVAELEADMKDMDEQIARLNAERAGLLPGIDSSVLRVYTRVFKRTGVAALVPIRNRTCGGCHLSVTAQLVNLAARQEELVICENCSRILYYMDDDEDAEANAAETGEEGK